MGFYNAATGLYDFCAAKAARDDAAQEKNRADGTIRVNLVDGRLCVDVWRKGWRGWEWARIQVPEDLQETLRLDMNAWADHRKRLDAANAFALSGPPPKMTGKRPLCRLTAEGYSGSPRKSGCARHRGHSGDCKNGEGKTYPKNCPHPGMVGLTGPLAPECPWCGAALSAPEAT